MQYTKMDRGNKMKSQGKRRVGQEKVVVLGRVGPQPIWGDSRGVDTAFLDNSLDPVCRDPLSCLGLSYSALLPRPPAGRLMSWLRRGLMGMQSCHQCCLGTVAGLPEKLQRQGSTWGQEAHEEAREG